MKGEMKQMPFIGNKVTVKISEEKEKAIKEKLGKAIELLGKSEQYLMIGFEDNYKLYFAGEKLEKGAFIEVKLFGIFILSNALHSLNA